MAYATASGHPEVYEQLDGEQENFEEEEQEEEIQVLMETGYTRLDAAYDVLWHKLMQLMFDTLA